MSITIMPSDREIVWVPDDYDPDCLVVIRPNHTINRYYPGGFLTVKSKIQLTQPLEYIRLDLTINGEEHG